MIVALPISLCLLYVQVLMAHEQHICQGMSFCACCTQFEAVPCQSQELESSLVHSTCMAYQA